MRIIYSFIFYLLTPLLLIKLWMRGKKAPAYRKRVAERFGFPSKVSDESPLWIHAVSVGETVAISSVVKRLLQKNPCLNILITTSTPTGADRVATLYKDYPRVIHQYCPYDQPHAVANFLFKHKPIGLLIVETELWPNMLFQCKKREIPVLLANARMSDKSARGYSKLASMTKEMLNQVDMLVAQYISDGECFKKLGLADEKLVISGSVKFDLSISEQTLSAANELRETIGNRPVVILGSSHPSEEKGVLELLLELWRMSPKLLFIIVPRHPERFEEVAQLARQYSSQVVRRSASQTGSTQIPANCQIYIGDTMGELGLLYAASDLAIVGGSFVELGGQNPIEPAAVGKGVLMGPQQYNFSVICPQMESAQGLITCQSYQELSSNLQELLLDTEKLTKMGQNAQHYVKQQQGATEVLLEKIEQVLLKK